MSETTTDCNVLFVTCPNEETALAIARPLVAEHLAACVNLIPGIRSIYQWEGRICDDAEWLLIIKTRRALVDSLIARIGAQHPYETPEIIALPIEAGSKDYLTWIADVTQT